MLKRVERSTDKAQVDLALPPFTKKLQAHRSKVCPEFKTRVLRISRFDCVSFVIKMK